MPGPFIAADTLVGPIVHAIAVLVSTQIPGIAYVYEKLPDQSPQDNSVIIPLTSGKLLHDYSGMQQWQLTFSMRHLFRRKKMSDNVAQAYTFIMPWLNFLGAWPNQTLGGLAEEVTANALSVTQMSESAQPMVALQVNFNVIVNFPIPTS